MALPYVFNTRNAELRHSEPACGDGDGGNIVVFGCVLKSFQKGDATEPSLLMEKVQEGRGFRPLV